MDADLLNRIRRLNVAIGRFQVRDLSKLPAIVSSNERSQLLVQDFSGGMSEAEIAETLYALIANVASFHDHLQKWGDENGVSRETVHNFLKQSFDFCVVRDLWNNDKHGYPPRNDGWSKKAPRILHAHAICEMKVGPTANSTTTMTMGRRGQPVVHTKGDGGARAVLTGEVVDKNGGGLGDAHKFIEAAVRVCETALRKFVDKP